MATNSAEQLKEIYKSLCQKDGKKIVLLGEQGVGKTWMAKKICDRAIREKKFHIKLWVFLCRDFDSTSLCRSFAQQLSLLSTTDEWEGEDDKEAKMEDEKEENVEKLKLKIQQALEGKEVLLILDDAGSKLNEGDFLSMLKDVLPDYETLSYKVLITTASESDIPQGTFIEPFKVLPVPPSQALLEKKIKIVETGSTSFKTLAEAFIKRSKGLHATVTLIAKALKYFGQNEAEVQMVKELLEELPKDKDVRPLLLSKYGEVPISILLDFCWPGEHFFRDSGGVHYNELITYWILEGYFGHVDCMKKTYEQGYHVVMELMDCGLLKKQVGGYVSMVSMDGSNLNLDDWHRCFGKTASLGLATVFPADLRGFGRITHKDGMIKTVFKGKKDVNQSSKEKGQNQSTEEKGQSQVPEGKEQNVQSKEEGKKALLKEKGQNLSTLLLDGKRFSGEVLVDFLQYEHELQVLAFFNPTFKSVLRSSPSSSLLPPSSLSLPLDMMQNLRILVLRGCEFLEKVKLNLKHLTVLEISGATSLEEMPGDFFKDMVQLQSLRLSGLQIPWLPDSFYELKELHWLTVKDCPVLGKIESLTKLTNLLGLDFSANPKLEFIDKNFLKMKKLQTIDLSKTQIRTTPLLKNLDKLTHLLLRDCTNLVRLRGLNYLSSLQTLDLFGSKIFEEFHDSSLESLSSLRTLDLSGTAVDHLPSNISNPVHFYLQNCSLLKQLPCIEKLEALEVLDLSCSENLDQIEEGFFDDLTSLRVLNLSKTKVKALPSLSKLLNLRELLLSDCCALVNIDKSFEHMSQLQRLDLSETKIDDLPILPNSDNLCQLLLKKCTNMKKLSLQVPLTKLEELNLSGVSSFTQHEAAFLKDMCSLRILDLSYTQLEELPSMSKLRNLTHLSLQRCHLKVVPNMETLTKLEVLDLSGTPVTGQLDLNKFSNLRQLLLRDCSSLKVLNLEIKDLLGSTPNASASALLELTSLEYFDFPNIMNNQGVDKKELDQDQWSITILSDSSKPPLSVGSAQFLQLLTLLDTSFHLCVRPIKGQSEAGDRDLQRIELIFGDIYFHTGEFASFRKKRSLQVRGFDNVLIGMENVLSHVDCVLFIDNTFNHLPLGFSGYDLESLKGCWVERCNEMTAVFHEEDNASLRENLTVLGISNAPRLETLCSGTKQYHGIFKNLTSLYLDNCPKLSTVFPSSWLPENLKVLHIKFCDKLETLFAKGSSQRRFPNLVTLHLWELPELQSIGDRDTYPSLQTPEVWKCPKLQGFVENIVLENSE